MKVLFTDAVVNVLTILKASHEPLSAKRISRISMINLSVVNAVLYQAAANKNKLVIMTERSPYNSVVKRPVWTYNANAKNL